MTTPTREQLAANVPPMIREYIDAAITEAVQSVSLKAEMHACHSEEIAKSVTDGIAQMKQFEREVRTHLKIYIQE